MDRRSAGILIITSVLGLATAAGLYGQFGGADQIPAANASIEKRESPQELIDRVRRLSRSGAVVDSLVPLAVEAMRNLDREEASADETRLAHAELSRVSPELVREERVNLAHLIALTHALQREDAYLPIASCHSLLEYCNQGLSDESNRHVFDQTAVTLARLSDSPAWHQSILEYCSRLSPLRQAMATSAVDRVAAVQSLDRSGQVIAAN